MPEARFSGDPKTIWLSEAGPDRRMSLLEPFWFDDRGGRRWDAAAGTTIDGASIPRALWSLVGSPYTGDYRRASIIHDVACVEATGDPVARRAADKMFYVACRAGGCSIWDATILYIGVRIGAWHSTVGLQDDGNEVKIKRDAIDQQTEEDFQLTCEQVLRQGESDDPDVLESRTDQALRSLALTRAALIERTLTMVCP